MSKVLASKISKLSTFAIAIMLITIFASLYGSRNASQNSPLAQIHAPRSVPAPQINAAPVNPPQIVNSQAPSENVITVSDQPGSLLDPSGALPSTPELSDDGLDKKWSKAHGLLDLEDFIRLNKIGMLELERLANSGDVDAMSAYGAGPMARSETAAQGQTMLFDAAARGSIFALHELATRLGPAFPGGTIEHQIAYRQVALSLGDVGIVPFLTQDVRGASPEQYAMSQFIFANVMSQLAALRMQQTGQGLVPNFRPLPNQSRKK